MLAFTMQVELRIHVFQLNDEGPAEAEEEGEEATPAYSEWQLPATAFCGLWDSLVYEYVSGYPELLLHSALRDTAASMDLP